MDNNSLEEIGRMAIGIEMGLFSEKKQFEEQAQGQSKEKIEETAARIARMQKMSDGIQEYIRMRRNDNKQAALLNSIEIVGLPDDVCENCEDVAELLSEIIKVHIVAENIRGFESVEEFTGPDLGMEGPTNVQSRTLVVHLVDLTLRNYIISLVQHTQLNYPGAGNIYVYEHLTHMNRMLFQRAQQEASRLHIKFVWVQDGKIYARKDDQSEVHHIRSDIDIKEMVDY